MGYSPASRYNRFQCLEENGSGPLVNDLSNDPGFGISDIDLYLRLLALLPSEVSMDDLITIHFSEENWSFPVLDEHHFRGLYKDFQSQFSKLISSKTTIHLSAALSSFPALLFSVLAVTLQFMPLDTEVARTLKLSNFSECDRVSQSYIDTGQEIIELIKYRKPTTTSIEFYITKTMWLKNCGRGNESWQSLGTALRQAQEIDLHQIRDDSAQASGVGVEQTLRRLWELEHQKRLWARLFILDSHMAMALGRPRGIHREDCTTPTPLDCDYPSDPLRTVPISTKHSYEPPNKFSPLMFWISLSHKIHDMMSMRASKLDLKDYSKVQALHEEVYGLLNDLPPALRPLFPDTSFDSQKPQLVTIRQRIMTMANIFFLTLHRPYVPTHVASQHAATEAAFEILQTQQQLFEAVPASQQKLYGHSSYTIDAGVFIAAAVMRYSNDGMGTSIKALQALQKATRRLTLMKHRSIIARSGEQILQRCCHIIQANISSPSSAESRDNFSDWELPTEATSLLEHLNPYVHEEPVQGLISMLTSPSNFSNLSATAALPFDGFQQQNHPNPVFPTIQRSGLSYSDLTSSTDSWWHV